jgi:exopolyphosphatase/guanosine-5'-triphosphate,3'-diphosphate pyrophosphatase
LRKVSDYLTDPDFAKAVVALRLSILFMHSRISVDDKAVRLRMKSRIDLEIKRDRVAEHPTLSYWMEKEQEFWDEIGVDFSIRTAA